MANILKLFSDYSAFHNELLYVSVKMVNKRSSIYYNNDLLSDLLENRYLQ